MLQVSVPLLFFHHLTTKLQERNLHDQNNHLRSKHNEWPNLPAVPGEAHISENCPLFFFPWITLTHQFQFKYTYLKVIPEKNANELCNGHMLSHQILLFTYLMSHRRLKLRTVLGTIPTLQQDSGSHRFSSTLPWEHLEEQMARQCGYHWWF